MDYDSAILVGSRAVKFWFAHAREPRDFDFFIDADALDEWGLHYRYDSRNAESIGDDHIKYELRIGLNFGFDNTRHESVKLFIDANKNMPKMAAFGLKFRIASPETLLAIKRSHAHHRHNWHKHIADYSWLKAQGVSFESREDVKHALEVRRKERDGRGEFKRPVNLAKPNTAFFEQSDKAVRRKFVHDDIHRAVMYGTRPLFERAKRDQSKAMLDRNLFEAFSFQDKCRLVREEAFVIGLERIVIPVWYNQKLLKDVGIDFDFTIDPNLIDQAYAYALMRISTDLTKGWFRKFAIENHLALRDKDVDFVAKFLHAIEDKRLVIKNA